MIRQQSSVTEVKIEYVFFMLQTHVILIDGEGYHRFDSFEERNISIVLHLVLFLLLFP